nr:MAG TPA: hypothetical protein [Caudoviricetes sp.]
MNVPAIAHRDLVSSSSFSNTCHILPSFRKKGHKNARNLLRLPGKDDKIHLFKVHFIGYPGKIGSALVLVALELIYFVVEKPRYIAYNILNKVVGR